MGIIELNQDVVPYVQNASGITFVHISDIHAKPHLWNRMVEYINCFAEQIAFAVHTGDYCGGSQKEYVDMYRGKKCLRPIFNCVGNHDCYSGEGPWLLCEKEKVYELLFNHTDNWDVSFFTCPHSMSYYKDFPGLRLIVLDDYYHTWQTRPWLRNLLKEAYALGLHVITAQHEPTGYISNTYGSAFHTLDDYNSKFCQYELNRTAYDFDHRGRVLYEDVIAEFIEYGGKYVCNLAGHDHVDEFGLTVRGVLNIAVQNGTSWDALGDTIRVPGEKSEDCFNVMSVDTQKGQFTLVRVGANTDRHGRVRNKMVFDYLNKRIIEEK
jgi:hypothetical protein